jgi:AcrR family transcriptional regulator
MAPDDRRAALVAATLPLVREHGRKVSTRQIAAAAGIAEGTIFRVFPNKDALIDAVMESAFDPAEPLARLAEIDRTLPLRERLVCAVEQFQERFQSVFQLLMALRMERPPDRDRLRGKQPPDPRNAQVNAAMAELIGDDRDKLRVPPEELVRLLRLLTFSGSHPLITEGRLLTPHEIVDALLDGTLQPNQSPRGI